MNEPDITVNVHPGWTNDLCNKPHAVAANINRTPVGKPFATLTAVSRFR